MSIDPVLRDTAAPTDDAALAALVTLSETAKSTICELETVQRQLDDARRRRRRGWSWRRIVGAADMDEFFPSLTRITGCLARSSGQFRRAIVVALRGEGSRATEVADELGVSRQRVSALTRLRRRT